MEEYFSTATLLPAGGIYESVERFKGSRVIVVDNSHPGRLSTITFVEVQ
jgi:hypothetical protein